VTSTMALWHARSAGRPLATALLVACVLLVTAAPARARATTSGGATQMTCSAGVCVPARANDKGVPLDVCMEGCLPPMAAAPRAAPAASAPHTGLGRTAADGAAACVIGGENYDFLANIKTDYTAQSMRYPNYEFVFNVCRDLVWVEGKCTEGSSMCERLKATLTSTGVYGKSSTQTTGVDDTGPYFEYAGDSCQISSGLTMMSRIYPACGTTQTAKVVYESYYDCQVHVKLSDPRVCRPSPPSPPPSPPPQQTFFCVEGTCKVTEEGGVTKGECEEMCKPEPLYVCTAGECVRATGAEKGVPHDVCQKGCRKFDGHPAHAPAQL